MKKELKPIFNRLLICSELTLREYISKYVDENETGLRFFSYGSNMNEGKFRKDTKKAGHEFGLKNVTVGVLHGFKRILGNKSKNHGCAFTICHSEEDFVQGIIHDIPITGLEAFLKKEGVSLSEPTYELALVTISNEKHPILTLKGLKPFRPENLDCREKLLAFHYVSTSIEGAERWGVEHADMLEIKDWLEEQICRINHSV
jgi:hypothetical protein